LSLTDLPRTSSAISVYAIEPTGRSIKVGTVTSRDGAATLNATMAMPLDNFSLALSPEASLIAAPEGREVNVRLKADEHPSCPRCRVAGKILRTSADTTFNLTFLGLPRTGPAISVYAVELTGRSTKLGTITTRNGVDTLSAAIARPLDNFTLTLSPETNATYATATSVIMLKDTGLASTF
jgi:hypothetical protein